MRLSANDVLIHMSDDCKRRNPQLLDMIGAKPEKASKMGNQKVLHEDGVWFSSKKEAARYDELKLLKKAGVVREIELQPRFLLQEGYMDGLTGKWVKKMEYVADFRVTYADGSVEVEDVKASAKFKTKEYRIKNKLFRRKYPEIVFREIY